MNAHERRLKSIIASAVNDAGIRFGEFRAKYDVDDLFESVLKDDDEPAVIAAKALEHLCAEEGGAFNGNVVGLKACMQFIAETSIDEPQAMPDVEDCQRDLRRRRFVDTELLTWINQWYRF